MLELTELTVFFKGWAIPSLLTAGSLCLMLLLKRAILVHLGKRNNGQSPNVLIKSLQFPLTLLIIIVHLFLLSYLLMTFQITTENVTSSNSLVARVLVIVALILFADRFFSGLINGYAKKSEVLRNSNGIARGIIHVIVYGIGLLIIMDTLGFSITPIVASLGITSLAVALALQPTLENFFSGLQLILDKPIRVGDFIELDSGEQGFVDKIGWRSTWIKMLPNNMVIMPNSKLSNSKVINYYYPQKELSVPVEVAVHYKSDLEHVERVTLEVAREILRTHEWGVPDYNTFVLFHTFDNSSINFTVMLRAKEYFNRFWIKSAFIKALHKRFAEEGITIPFPIRAINLEQEGAADMLRTEQENSA